MTLPLAVQAGLWGLLSGSALLIGAVIGWYVPLSRRTIAGIMAFGAGVLISALSFELMEEAWEQGGLWPVATGFLVGALVYTLANLLLARAGAKHRKRSAPEVREEHPREANAQALALGALLDGIPESIVIGISLLGGGAVGLVAVAAVFLSNLPEGLSSAAGMKAEGKSAGYTFALWSGIALASAASATVGYAAFDGAAPAVTGFIQAIAAGAILAMVVDTMVPEAFEGTHDFAGLIAVSGFLLAFALSQSAS